MYYFTQIMPEGVRTKGKLTHPSMDLNGLVKNAFLHFDALLLLYVKQHQT